MKRLIYIVLLIAALPLMPHPSGSGTSWAVLAADEQDDVLKAIKRGDVMPYSKIKRIAESKLNGVVVGQQLRRTNRGWQYDLRVRRKDGRVMVAIVNAQTGEILRTR
ncbi:PepSY domain-containing protein [Kordiimonas sp.]|uniref:PepSY domain-containing protein n=1 Tax=Kordiimonas sp. TaxID=1970157 RepID=UPI003A90BED1